ncbi:hypothetical protein [Streptomyces sp. NBC_00696]|uniref:Uncharacterized protein n=1 Tax=Streptomyces sp. R08 TaxID=3238624 RepID=A0AB39M714_9ACTN|nr:hypothetical protein [Streptomyces sp. NBC_00696]
MVQQLGAVFPPNPHLVGRIGDWLSDQPGATVDEIAAEIFPGKVPGRGRITDALRTMAGQCRLRRDDVRWYPAG